MLLSSYSGLHAYLISWIFKRVFQIFRHNMENLWQKLGLFLFTWLIGNKPLLLLENKSASFHPALFFVF